MGGCRPDLGRRCRAQRRCCGDDPRGRDHDARRRRLRCLHGVGPARMVGRRDGGRALFRGERSSSVRRAHDPPDPSPDRLPRGHARGGISSRDAAGSLRRKPRLPRGAQGGHPGIARGARRGRPLFRRLQGADGGRRDHRTARGRSARHRERGASRTAGLDGMAAHRDERELDHARLRQTPRVERTPCVSRTAQLGGGRLRALAGQGRDASCNGCARRHLPDQQYGLHRLLHRSARGACPRGREQQRDACRCSRAPTGRWFPRRRGYDCCAERPSRAT